MAFKKISHRNLTKGQRAKLRRVMRFYKARNHYNGRTSIRYELLKHTDLPLTYVTIETRRSDCSQRAIVCKMYFDNGYGASIVTGEYAYTDKDNPYELAILIKNKGITYSTHITDDVLGHQNESDIEDVLRKIEALPPVEV